MAGPACRGRQDRTRSPPLKEKSGVFSQFTHPFLKRDIGVSSPSMSTSTVNLPWSYQSLHTSTACSRCFSILIEVFSFDFLKQLFPNYDFSKFLGGKTKSNTTKKQQKTPIVLVQHASVAHRLTADGQVVIGDAVLQFLFFFRLCFSWVVFRIAPRILS